MWGADGHLYVSGATLVAGDRQLAVWRIDKTTNRPDPTFGTNGVVTVAIPGDETSYDLLALKDGSFVVHAVSGGKVWLAKLTKDAGGVYSFGAPRALVFGWEDADFPNWPVAGATPAYGSWGLALDSSGAAEKIVVFASGPPAVVAAGVQRTDADRWVARLLAMSGLLLLGLRRNQHPKVRSGALIGGAYLLTPLAGRGIWIGLAIGLAVVAVMMLWRWWARERLGLLRWGLREAS